MNETREKEISQVRHDIGMGFDIMSSVYHECCDSESEDWDDLESGIHEALGYINRAVERLEKLQEMDE